MDIAFADAPEIVEIDAQLIGRVRGAHEGGLVDTEPLDEAADVRQGRLADPDDADILAFDQRDRNQRPEQLRSEEHTSELQSLMRISYAVFCWKKKNTTHQIRQHTQT